MPKYSSCPAIFDYVKSFSISDLKQMDYLSNASKYKSGILTWSRNGNKTGSISISIDMGDQPFIELEYTCNDEAVKYQVKLVSVPSNLGKGKVWYFLCPHTEKRCRKLYCVRKYFLHREAFPDAMYEKQTYSEYGRNMDKAFSAWFGVKKIFDEIHSKNFKTHYAGKPTKRYKRLLAKLVEADKMKPQAMKFLKKI